jgi:hypothetical protein
MSGSESEGDPTKIRGLQGSFARGVAESFALAVCRAALKVVGA